MFLVLAVRSVTSLRGFLFASSFSFCTMSSPLELTVEHSQKPPNKSCNVPCLMPYRSPPQPPGEKAPTKPSPLAPLPNALRSMVAEVKASRTDTDQRRAGAWQETTKMLHQGLCHLVSTGLTTFLSFYRQTTPPPPVWVPLVGEAREGSALAGLSQIPPEDHCEGLGRCQLPDPTDMAPLSSFPVGYMCPLSTFPEFGTRLGPLTLLPGLTGTDGHTLSQRQAEPDIARLSVPLRSSPVKGTGMIPLSTDSVGSMYPLKPTPVKGTASASLPVLSGRDILCPLKSTDTVSFIISSASAHVGAQACDCISVSSGHASMPHVPLKAFPVSESVAPGRRLRVKGFSAS